MRTCWVLWGCVCVLRAPKPGKLFEFIWMYGSRTLPLIWGFASMHKVKQMGWQVSRLLTEGESSALAILWMSGRQKFHPLNPHVSFRENCCCSVWPLLGFLVGRGWVCCGLSALSWGSHDSPGEWIGLSKRAVGVYTPWMVLLGLSQARPFRADHRMDRNLLRCDLWCPPALLGPAEGGTLRWC